LWVIDLAQGVDRQHVNSLGFLQRDCKSVSDFFRSKGLVGVLSTRQLFDYVTTAEMGNPEEVLAARMAECASANNPDPDAQDAVWYASFIPQSLSDLHDPEHAQSIDRRDRFHDNLVMDEALGSVDDSDDDDDDDDNDDKDDDDRDEHGLSSASSSSPDESTPPNDNRALPGPSAAGSAKKVPMNKAERKAHKRIVKKEQRARRAQKSKMDQ
jgi:hypothetical protein